MKTMVGLAGLSAAAPIPVQRISKTITMKNRNDAGLRNRSLSMVHSR
jgi:hypothetical protein